MKSNCLAVLLLALPLAAQADRAYLTDGTTLEGITVLGFDIRELKYRKGGSSLSLSSDKVLKLELESFRDAYRIALRDPGLMLTKAREQLKADEPVLAQIGFTRSAAMFFDNDQAVDADNVLQEFEKEMPNAGFLPEIYRQKFEYYMGQGSAAGARNAGVVAQKYFSAAQGNAWPAGFGIEAEFFQALAEHMAGGNPAAFQGKLQAIIGSARVENPLVANRANVQLANSLRETKDTEGARRIYEALVKKEGVDSSSLAGAYLGIGMLTLNAAGNDREEYRRAMLWFLRVYLVTKDCWPSLKAEALYHAVLAAGQWRGPNYDYIMARLRGVLKAEFPNSDWTSKALGK